MMLAGIKTKFGEKELENKKAAGSEKRCFVWISKTF
jgi:hypothetical protein